MIIILIKIECLTNEKMDIYIYIYSTYNTSVSGHVLSWSVQGSCSESESEVGPSTSSSSSESVSKASSLNLLLNNSLFSDS